MSTDLLDTAIRLGAAEEFQRLRTENAWLKDALHAANQRCLILRERLVELAPDDDFEPELDDDWPEDDE